MRLNSSVCLVISFGTSKIFSLYVPTLLIWSSQLWTSFILFTFLSVCRTTYWLILYPRFFTPYRHLPTPRQRWFLTGNESKFFAEAPWIVARRWSETVPNDGIIRYYGALSNERLLITKPEAIADVLVNRTYDFTKTNSTRFVIQRFTGEGLGFLEGDAHKFQRKQLQPAFNFRHIKDLYPVFWRKSIELVECLKQEIADTPSHSKSVAIHDWATRLTLDMIGVAGMGHDFEALTHSENELNENYRKMFIEPTPALRWLELLGNYVDLRVLLRAPVKRNLELTQGSNYVRRVAGDVIRDKIRKMDSKEDTGKDIISVALSSGQFTEKNLADHVMTFLVAGHEASAGALIWAIFELGRRPEMQSRLRQELCTHLPSLNSVEATDIDASTIGDLPYLNAICSEVLRFHPNVPLMLRRAAKDTTVNGTFVKKDTILVLAADAVNHDTSLWGPDAAEFNPERYMKVGDGKGGGATSNYAFLSFSHGPHSCIGQGFTRAELSCMLAAIFSTFDVRLVNEAQAAQIRGGLTLWPKEGTYVTLEKLNNR